MAASSTSTVSDAEKQRLQAFVNTNKADIVAAAGALGLDALGLTGYVQVLNPLTNKFVLKSVAVSEGWYNGETNEYKRSSPIVSGPFVNLVTPDPSFIIRRRPYDLVPEVVMLGTPIETIEAVEITGNSRSHHKKHNVVGVVKTRERRYV